MPRKSYPPRPPCTAEPVERRLLLSTYYVSASAGSDANAGSLAAPFATIQQAADVAHAGDTVLVRGGVYRESVKPARSGAAGAPITYQAFDGESVTVSGADPVSGWANHAGSIFQAPQPWDLGENFNQVFVDGQMMTEARWPNTPLDPSHPTHANADSVAANVAGAESFATLRDDALAAFPGGAWDGATVHFSPGEQWVWQGGRVTSSPSGSLAFDYAQRTGTKSEFQETPTAGDPYYLTGKFIALDAPGEWFRDLSSGRLYLWTPAGDDPSAHAVEAKRRQHAFDLSGLSYVTVRGFDLFAANVTTDAASSHVTIDGVHARYVSHFGANTTGWDNAALSETGIVLRGRADVLRNSTIEYSAGHGVVAEGAGHVVENNVIHDVGYNGANAAAIRLLGTGHLVLRNTAYNTGRNGIIFANTSASRILYNLVHDVMLQTTDGGAIYTFGFDGGGTEIAYNRVYNVTSGGFGAAGLYLDNDSRGYLLHHNLVYNANHALKMNDPSHNNRVYNNTLVGIHQSVDSNRQFEMTGTEFRNNVFTNRTDIGPTAVVSNNVAMNADPGFIDPANGDFGLAPGSRAIDFGTPVAPYTDGFAGAAPDAGAFESGPPEWVAGASDAYRGDTTPPAPPPGLTAAGNPAGVLLDWADVPDADRYGYDVFAGPSPDGPFAKLNGEPLPDSQFLDTAVAPGEARTYRVVALDTAGNASAPAAAGAARPVDAAPPAPVTNPRAAYAFPASVLARFQTYVALAWDPSPGAALYRIDRKGPADADFAPLGSATYFPTFTDTTAAPGTTYAYRVRAENALGASAGDPAASITTPSVPAAPTGLTVAPRSATRVDLTWAASADAAGALPDGTPLVQTYVVERSRDGWTNWVTIRTFARATTGFPDDNLPAGATYYYRVRSVGPGGVSEPTATAPQPATPPPAVEPPPAPSPVDPTPDPDPAPVPPSGPPPVVGEPPAVDPPAAPATPQVPVTVAAAFAGKGRVKGGKAYAFKVTFTSPNRINLASFGPDDVTATGPGGSGAAADLVKAKPKNKKTGTVVQAAYRLAAPGGRFDFADNGTYTLRLGPAAISDAAGGGTAAQDLGAFEVRAKAPKAKRSRAAAVLAAAPTVAAASTAGIREGRVRLADGLFAADPVGPAT